MIAVGRLKPGVSLAAAQAEATAITRQVLETRGEKPGGTVAQVVSLHDAFFGGATKGLTFLLGAVSFVLLIACANVANLLLAAGAARRKELALRAATGARRGRLMQQLLTENLLLSLVGCGFGLVLAFWGTRLFALIVPDRFPGAAAPHPRRRARARVRPGDLGRVQHRLRAAAGAARVAGRSQRSAQGRRRADRAARAPAAAACSWSRRWRCRWCCSSAPA